MQHTASSKHKNMKVLLFFCIYIEIIRDKIPTTYVPYGTYVSDGTIKGITMGIRLAVPARMTCLESLKRAKIVNFRSTRKHHVNRSFVMAVVIIVNHLLS
jgi:hypothetical protein